MSALTHPNDTKQSSDNTALLMRVENLKIGYIRRQQETTVSENVNLSLNKGKIICLLGQNGAGKSTLLRTLAGVQKPLAGNIFLEGKALSTINKAELAKRLSLVLAERISAGNLSVYTLLSLGRYPHLGWFSTLNQHDREVISEAIKSMGIEAHVDKSMHELSDGEQQKVMIARALVQDTPLIILDEPTAHLDIPSRIEIMYLLRKMVKTTGKTVLLSSHELDLALQVADDIWLMGIDQAILSGTAEDLILSGSFEQAFNHKSYRFCLATGTFKGVASDSAKDISISGDDTSMFWTQRALEREGYRIVADAVLSVDVQSEDERQWHLKTGDKSTRFSSIKELLDFLQGQ